MNQFTSLERPTSRPADDRRPGASWRWLLVQQPGRWLLPATGLWILGLDWLLFTKNALVLGLATPVLVIVGLVAGSAGAYFLQRRYAGDRGLGALAKALVAGAVVGVPLPIAGTIVGGWILLASGLGSMKDRVLRR